MANRSPNKTRALSCRKITRGLARGRKCYRRRFLLRHPSPDSILVITGVRRGQGSARETLRRKNPERGSRPGFPELSLILGSRPYGGVSRGWGAAQPAHERQRHLCRGMGVPYIRGRAQPTLEQKGIETHLATNKRREGSGCEARDRGPNPRRRRSPHREVCLVERRFSAA